MNLNESGDGLPTLKIGLLIWTGSVRELVRQCLHLLGVEEITLLPTTFPPAISASFLEPYSQVDLAIVEAFNPAKKVRDAEGFRLARLLSRQTAGRCRMLVLFKRMPDSMRQHPCFIDYATFADIGHKIAALKNGPDVGPIPFEVATTAWPALANIPIHP